MLRGDADPEEVTVQEEEAEDNLKIHFTCTGKSPSHCRVATSEEGEKGPPELSPGPPALPPVTYL